MKKSLIAFISTLAVVACCAGNWLLIKAGCPPGWSPDNSALPMIGWYDPSVAANVVKDGSNLISNLKDQSPTLHNATQATAAMIEAQRARRLGRRRSVPRPARSLA